MSEFIHTENNFAFVNAIESDLINRVKHSKITVEKLAAKFGIENKNIIKELTELAIVRIARSIAQDYNLTNHEKYVLIVDLYNNQVNLSHRTSESIMLQQYSTPAPIGYLAGLFVLGENSSLSGNGYKAFRKIALSDKEFKKKYGVNPGETDHTQKHPNYSFNKKYLEPSAGNGLLTIALNPQSVIVNELDDVRNANLKTLGFAQVYRFDATKNFAVENNFFEQFDGIITNPPFGSLETEVTYGTGSDKFPIKTLDHLMCLRSLDCMKSTGRAAMIIGGHTNWDELGRIQAGKNRIFFNYLYRYYNVDDVINIDGHKLYSRQGTAFDVRLILVNGRKYKPEGAAPLKQSHDTTVYSFDELWERVMLSMGNEVKVAIEKKTETKTDSERESIINELADSLAKNEIKYINDTFLPLLNKESTYITIKGTVTQEKINEVIERIKSNSKGIAENYIRLFEEKKDYKKIHGLITNTVNKSSRRAFERLTGIKVGKTVKEAEQAVTKYFGKEFVDSYNNEQRKIKEEKEKQNKQTAIDSELNKKVKSNGVIKTWKQHIDDSIENGFDKYDFVKRGATQTLRLKNEKGKYYPFRKKVFIDYIKEKIDNSGKSQKIKDIESKLKLLKEKLEKIKSENLSGFEVSRIEQRKAKNGNIYFWQEILIYEGAKDKIIWKGKCSKADWDRHHEIWEEQPERRIQKSKNYISVEN